MRRDRVNPFVLTKTLSRYTATLSALLVFGGMVCGSANAEVVSLWIEVQGTRCPP